MVGSFDLSTTAAVFLRCTGMFSILPLSQIHVSGAHRIGLSLLLALVLQEGVATQPVSGFGIGGEFLIGMLLAMPAALLLQCAIIWGELLDWGRGLTMANLIDPASQHSLSPFSILMNWLLWCYVLLMGGVELLVAGLLKSYQAVPAYGLTPLALSGVGAGLLSLISQQLNGAFSAFLPLAAIYLLVDLSVGLLSKLVPQVCFSHESFILKSGLALVFLMIAAQLQLESSLPAVIRPDLNYFGAMFP